MTAKSSSKKSAQTGPKTSTGKAVSAMNAIKLGIHITGWLDEHEHSEYSILFEQLTKEYNANTPTMLIQIERMASTMIKMRRLQKIEAALFLRARQIANRFSQERSSPSTTGPSDHQLSALTEFAALPDMDKLATLQRYQTSLDRQLSKIIGEIRVLSMTRSPSQNAIQHAQQNTP